MHTEKDYYKINNYHHFSEDNKKHYNGIKYDSKVELLIETIEYWEVKLMQYIGWDADVITLTKLIDDVEEIKIDDNTKNKEQAEVCIYTLNKYNAWLEELIKDRSNDKDIG